MQTESSSHQHHVLREDTGQCKYTVHAGVQSQSRKQLQSLMLMMFVGREPVIKSVTPAAFHLSVAHGKSNSAVVTHAMVCVLYLSDSGMHRHFFFFSLTKSHFASAGSPGNHSENLGSCRYHCWLILGTNKLAQQESGGESPASGLSGRVGRGRRHAW